MAKRDIIVRLASGERLLLDGGTGSELGRRGVNVSRRITAQGNSPWSATANADAPDVVRAIHEDYLCAGTDIVTTNSFWSNRTRLGVIGLADKMEEYTRLSVEFAQEARDSVNPMAFVAGSMAPPMGRPRPGVPLTSDDFSAEFADQAAVLAGAGVDVILLEYVSSIHEAVTLLDAASSTGLPVFLGIKRFEPHWDMRTCETVEQLVKALEGRQVGAILDMCSPPEAISAGLPRLREAFDGPIGAYANIGYTANPESLRDIKQQWLVIDVGENTPDRYAKFGRQWLDMGTQIVGGCCASGPEHIAALRPIVKG